MTNIELNGIGLRSTITSGGSLRLNLERHVLPEPSRDEVTVRVQATPLNPSDIGLLLGPADLSTLKVKGEGDNRLLTADVSSAFLAGLKARLDQPMHVGNEGAGVIVKAGANAQHLLGKQVGIFGGGMYTQYRTVPAGDCIVLPDGASAADGASMFVNPLTALAMVETMRMEGHRALVHTAAASNLGLMLNRLCRADGVQLVNIVRSRQQSDLLKEAGAQHVVDSSASDFQEQLTDAVAQTGATLAFDAIGGGTTANSILHAMEAAANRNAPSYSRYGSNTFKRVYTYGSLDSGPTVIDRRFGMSWGIGGFLIMHFLEKIGWEATLKLRNRVASELLTTFASQYRATITLRDLLDPETIVQIARKATGAKYLIDPSA